MLNLLFICLFLYGVQILVVICALLIGAINSKKEFYTYLIPWCILIPYIITYHSIRNFKELK